jgi:predicted dienelactone hydrolase
MRPFEILLIIVVIVAAVLQMTNFGARWLTALTLLGVVVGALHVVLEGTHWQIFPVLAGLVLLVIWQLIPMRLRTSRYPTVRTRLALAIAILSGMSFGALLLVPMFSLPKPTGQYPVGTRIIYLKDTNRTEADGRPRELIVQLWYPAAPSNNHLAAYQRRLETSFWTSYRSVLWTNSRMNAPIANGDPFMVLLFNHGWGERRTQNTFLTEDLASHGYVVAAIDHPYNSGRVAMPDGRVIEDAFGYAPIDVTKRTAAEIRSTWNQELARWVADEVFVLTSLQNENLDPNSFWYGRLDTSHAGAFGHSFGGAASIQVCSVDPRIRSALNMDGWTFGDIRYHASNQPMMFMYGSANLPRPQELNSKDHVKQTEAELDVNDMKQIDSSLMHYGGYKLYVTHASHLDFTDHSLVSPWRNWTERGHLSPARIQTIVRAYVLAFFDQTLKGENPAILQSGDTSPFPEIQIKRFTPESKVAPANLAQEPHPGR